MVSVRRLFNDLLLKRLELAADKASCVFLTNASVERVLVRAKPFDGPQRLSGRQELLTATNDTANPAPPAHCAPPDAPKEFIEDCPSRGSGLSLIVLPLFILGLNF